MVEVLTRAPAPAAGAAPPAAALRAKPPPVAAGLAAGLAAGATLHWLLRVARGPAFVGRGASGMITEAARVPYYGGAVASDGGRSRSRAVAGGCPTR
jgi:hypothetical protein